MNINQALRRLKIIKGRIAQWEQHADQSNIVEENTNPTYTFEECVSERKKALEELLQLSAAIAETNAATKITCDTTTMTLAAAIRKLDNIKAEIAWLRRIPVLAQTTVTTKRAKEEWDAKERTRIYIEVPYVQTCSMDARKQERLLERLQEDFDKLNTLVEGANHSTTLVG